MATSSNMPAWLRWTCRILGGLLVLAALFQLGRTLLAVGALARGKDGLMAHSGQDLAMLLGLVMGYIIGMLVGAWLVQISFKKATGSLASQALRPAGTTAVATAAVLPPPAKRSGGKRWQNANVLRVGEEFRQLWGFGAGKRGYNLSQENSIPTAEPLPGKLIAKDWKTLFQSRLNVAWLPVDQVFLRVAQLPVGDFDETLQMVELQLEKLSPLPVTQICWSIHILPHHVDNLQTVIITIVSRDIVEEYLGKLEAQGFLADRLELPLVDQLQATPITGDGAWVYVSPDTTKFSALVAWWYGGVLRNLALLHVPAVDNRNAMFKEQINQMTWSGELEGWLTAAPHWHLVADEAEAANWVPMFREGLGQAPEVLPPLAESDLAALTANRAANSNPRSNILPIEYTTRYRQQFVDGLWMRGLGTVIVGYIVCAAIYLAVASVQNLRADNVEVEMRGLSVQYTNTLQLAKKLQILQDRQDLKRAALDTWKITAELLPEGLTVQSLEFKNGKSFTIFGNATSDADGVVNDFNDAMRKAPGPNGKPFFEKMELALTHRNGNNLSWSFSGELVHGEEAAP